MVWKACPSGRAGPLVRSGTQSWRRGPVSYEAAGRPGRSGPRAVMGSAGVDSARTRAGGAAGGPLRPPGWLHGCPAPQAQEGGQEAAPEARTATEGTSWGPGAARGDTAGRPVPAGGDPGRRGSGASPPPPRTSDWPWSPQTEARPGAQGGLTRSWRSASCAGPRALRVQSI